jgi:hypothetical protein
MEFGLPDSFYDTALRMREKMNFYCPAGHSQHFCTGQSDLEKMRLERDRAVQEQARLHDRIREERESREAMERKNIATRGVVTRMKNRAANGVCLCCNRTFANLQKHMETKHPQFKKEDVA